MSIMCWLGAHTKCSQSSTWVWRSRSNWGGVRIQWQGHGESSTWPMSLLQKIDGWSGQVEAGYKRYGGSGAVLWPGAHTKCSLSSTWVWRSRSNWGGVRIQWQGHGADGPSRTPPHYPVVVTFSQVDPLGIFITRNLCLTYFFTISEARVICQEFVTCAVLLFVLGEPNTFLHIIGLILHDYALPWCPMGRRNSHSLISTTVRGVKIKMSKFLTSHFLSPQRVHS